MVDINFACKIVPLDTVLKCSFGINKTDVEILKLLLHSYDELSVEDIMKKVKKDKTTVQRSMKSLHEALLAKRMQHNLPHGGFVYQYSSISKDEIKEKIYQNLDNFKQSIAKEIKNM